MRSLFAILLIVLVALSGCAETGDMDADLDGTPDTPDVPADGNFTPVITPIFTADVVNGTAPLLVNFTVDAVNGTDLVNATWSIAFGDGNATNGTGLPAMTNHTFGPGNFTSVVSMVVDGISINASVVTSVADGVVAEPPRELPEVTHFEFADSLGCAGDVLQIAGQDCFSFMEGPSASGIDGYWLELGSAYWGLKLSSTVDNLLGDSDCTLTDADFAVVGRLNNGGDPCGGVVPDGTAWLFIYSYAEFAMSQTVDFAL